MSVESVELVRLVLATLIILGYTPVVLAHRRRGTTWMFYAHTVLVAGAVLLLVGAVRGLFSAPFIFRVAVATSAILFFVSAYRSKEKIDALEEEAEEERIEIGGGM